MKTKQMPNDPHHICFADRPTIPIIARYSARHIGHFGTRMTASKEPKVAALPNLHACVFEQRISDEAVASQEIAGLVARLCIPDPEGNRAFDM